MCVASIQVLVQEKNNNKTQHSNTSERHTFQPVDKQSTENRWNRQNHVFCATNTNTHTHEQWQLLLWYIDPIERILIYASTLAFQFFSGSVESVELIFLFSKELWICVRVPRPLHPCHDIFYSFCALFVNIQRAFTPHIGMPWNSNVDVIHSVHANCGAMVTFNSEWTQCNLGEATRQTNSTRQKCRKIMIINKWRGSRTNSIDLPDVASRCRLQFHTW